MWVCKFKHVIACKRKHVHTSLFVLERELNSRLNLNDPRTIFLFIQGPFQNGFIGRARNVEETDPTARGSAEFSALSVAS